MATSFPSSIDTGLADGITAGTAMNAPGFLHDVQHDNLRDAVIAIEQAIGSTAGTEPTYGSSLRALIGGSSAASGAFGSGATIEPDLGARVVHVNDPATIGASGGVGQSLRVTDTRTWNATRSIGNLMTSTISLLPNVASGVVLSGTSIDALRISGQPILAASSSRVTSRFAGLVLHWNGNGTVAGQMAEVVGVHSHLGFIGGSAAGIVDKLICYDGTNTNHLGAGAGTINDAIGLRITMGAPTVATRTWGLQLEGADNALTGNLYVGAPTLATQPGVRLNVGGPAAIFGILSVWDSVAIAGNAFISGQIERSATLTNAAAPVEMRAVTSGAGSGGSTVLRFWGQTALTTTDTHVTRTIAPCQANNVMILDIRVVARVLTGAFTGQGAAWERRATFRVDTAAVTVLSSIGIDEAIGPDHFDAALTFATISFNASPVTGLVTMNFDSQLAGTQVAWKIWTRVIRVENAT
jgi:hypothetical protein